MGLVIAVATIAGYGAAWWIVGFRATGHGGAAAYAAGVLPFVLLVAAAWRRKRRESPERRRERAQRGNIIGIVTGIQAVVILAVVKALLDAGRIDLLAPIAAIVMGLHFLAFARLFPAWIYFPTSGLLAALGAAGLFVPAGVARVLVVSVAAAAILWLTCVAVLLWPETRRKRAEPAPTPAPGPGPPG